MGEEYLNVVRLPGGLIQLVCSERTAAQVAQTILHGADATTPEAYTVAKACKRVTSGELDEWVVRGERVNDTQRAAMLRKKSLLPKEAPSNEPEGQRKLDKFQCIVLKLLLLFWREYRYWNADHIPSAEQRRFIARVEEQAERGVLD